MDYRNYSLEDFIFDEDFKKWVKNPDKGRSSFWNDWLIQNPDKAPVVERAKQAILNLSIDRDEPLPGELDTLWNRIDSSISEFENARTRRLASPFVLKVAASISGLLLLTTLLFYIIKENNNVVYTTNYGETREVLLPDNSVVTLNANSAIEFDESWNETEPRKIVLKGEAFFSVTHKVNKQPFIVIASDVNIEVLGTEFNVNNRRGRTRVVLNNGKVKLDYNQESLIMAPGDMVEVIESTNKISRSRVDVENYNCWLNKQICFSKATLKQVARFLEDNYGFQVVFKEKSLEDEVFTGVTGSGNVDEFLKILEKSFDMKITKTQGKLIFEN